jgi:hypothetical protein
MILLSLDAWKAIQRKAYWFPGGFLVLSALTLQFIIYVDYSTVSVSSGTEDITDEDAENFLHIQLVIDSGRLVICVFIAYLLPGMVSSRFRNVWGDIGAVALGVLAHMFSEIYLVYLYFKNSNSGAVWFKVFSAILFTAITLLVLLSICAVLAGKSIRIIINKKVPSLLSCCSNSRRDCGNIGDHVLKCWIVVRSSQPEYIMARSVLSSLAGLLVTVCVIAIVVKWRYVYIDDYETLLPLNKITIILQFIFSFIGWIVVAVRWLAAVKYFPIDGRSLFQVEDFWTRSIIDLKDGQLKGPLFREKRNRDRTLLETNIWDLIIAVRLHTLFLFIGLFLQKLVVLLSKASCFLSSILLWLVLKIHEKIMLWCGSNILESDFSKYRQLLEIIRMPGEISESLWIANESAFKSTKKHMEQGKGTTAELIKMISRQTEPAADIGKETCQEEEKYFMYAGKKSWKMKAVSFIHFMLCYYPDNKSGDVNDAIKACSEAWALMDFVESSDTAVNLASLAADKEFDTLQNTWNKRLKMKPTQSKQVRKSDQKIIESRIDSGKRVESEDSQQDSMDWMTAAANLSLYRTSKAIDLPSADSIDRLGRLLANVIVNCLAKELENALIEKCNKWAEDGKERDIYHAAFIAGKAKAVLILFKTSQGNNGVPPTVVEGKGNNSSGGEVVPDGEENDSSDIAKVVEDISELAQEIEDEDEEESWGDNNC